MPIIALPAHFDGKQICLDEPFNFKPETELIVTVLPNRKHDNEHENWLNLSAQKLEHAYGDNEPEYALTLLKEENNDYDRR